MAKGTVSLGLVGALKVSVRPLPGFSATWPQSADVGLGRTPEGLGNAHSVVRLGPLVPRGFRAAATFLGCSPLQPCRTCLWCDMHG
jgi:hypothetical protein